MRGKDVFSVRREGAISFIGPTHFWHKGSRKLIHHFSQQHSSSSKRYQPKQFFTTATLQKDKACSPKVCLERYLSRKVVTALEIETVQRLQGLRVRVE